MLVLIAKDLQYNSSLICLSENVLRSSYVWANSEDPDEMLQDAAFHQGLHCLLKKKSSEIENILFGIITPLYIQWTHPSLLNQTK